MVCDRKKENPLSSLNDSLPNLPQQAALDLFNYVSNNSNLTDQNVQHLLRLSFIDAGISAEQYDQMADSSISCA